MGDKSPKATQKQANQKAATKTKTENERKMQAAAPKTGDVKKK